MLDEHTTAGGGGKLTHTQSYTVTVHLCVMRVAMVMQLASTKPTEPSILVSSSEEARNSSEKSSMARLYLHTHTHTHTHTEGS